MNRLKIVFFFVFFLTLLTKVLPQEEVGRVSEKLLKAVVRINTPANQTGTGFLISNEITDNRDTLRVVFLVTNKHLVGDWNVADGSISIYNDWIDVFLYRRVTSQQIPTKVHLKDKSGNILKEKFILHPEANIDIVLINIFSELKADSIDFSSFDMTYLLPFASIKQWGTGLGDQIFALGYPLGVTSLKNNYPIAKSGYVASVPGEEFAINVNVINRNKQKVKTRLNGKILIIDGLIVGGNSGGPIVLPSELLIRRDPKTNQIQFGSKMILNFVIGIVSSTLGPSGLTVCYSSDYIIDLANLYLEGKL